MLDFIFKIYLLLQLEFLYILPSEAILLAYYYYYYLKGGQKCFYRKLNPYYNKNEAHYWGFQLDYRFQKIFNKMFACVKRQTFRNYT